MKSVLLTGVLVYAGAICALAGFLSWWLVLVFWLTPAAWWLLAFTVGVIRWNRPKFYTSRK